jgi:hypothetical protein
LGSGRIDITTSPLLRWTVDLVSASSVTEQHKKTHKVSFVFSTGVSGLVGLETITTTSTNFPFFFVHGSENKAIETAGGFLRWGRTGQRGTGFFQHSCVFILFF